MTVEPTHPLSRMQNDALAEDVSRIGAFLDIHARLIVAPQLGQ
jgi:hypothetical protein